MQCLQISIELRTQVVETVARAGPGGVPGAEGRNHHGHAGYGDQDPMKTAVEHAKQYRHADEAECQHSACCRQHAGDDAGDKAASRLRSFLANEGGVVGEVISDEFRMPEHRGKNRMKHGARGR